MEPLVSVIVPIYNVEKYLKKCVDSIINQTLTNIEIILVDDGSTDNCGQIIDEYANKDKRVVAIHKENGGQSSARNRGLDRARGKYVGFVDSDDWIESGMYENLYNLIEESCSDICVCGRQSYSQDGNLGYELEIKEELIDFNKIKLSSYVSNKLLYKHTVSTCNKLYQKSIIDNNNIRFEDVGYVGSEDALFNYNVLCHINKIKCIKKIYYNQLSRSGSTARTYKYGYMNRTANMIQCMYKYSVKTGNEEIYNSLAPIFLLFFYQWNMSNIKLASNENIELSILNEIKDASQNTEFMRCVRRLFLSNKSNKSIKNMGFRLSGMLFIKLIMGLYSLRRYNLTVKAIMLKS